LEVNVECVRAVEMKIGIIGGSGFYALDRLQNVTEREIDTPFGKPSAPIVCGTIGAHEIFFLARHGKGHGYPPSCVPHRANIFALKLCGVERILAITAVGSLKEDRKPGDIVVIDQYFDRLKQSYSFFDRPGVVAHVAFGDPICAQWREYIHAIAAEFCTKAGVRAFNGGTYVCMEGPAFSTRAESLFYRSIDASVIGMTSLPEAKLAREAEMCYSAISLVTDFDCWHVGEEAVTVEAVIAQMKRNISVATDITIALLTRLDTAPACASRCAHALQGAIMTHKAEMSHEVVRDLLPLIKSRMN